MNVPPGAFRIWIGRVGWGILLFLPMVGVLLVVLMLGAESRALDHSRTVLNAADSLLTSAMRSVQPESVPLAVQRLSNATGTTVVLLRNDGTSAFADERELDRIKAYVAIPEEWRTARHSPALFLWPPSGVPDRLPHEIDRVFSLRSAHIVADNHGQASPLALNGGYTAWVQAIPNRPSCARCHGFDKEVLGHWVVISHVDPVVGRHGTILWGFWPLPAMNQTFLFATTLGIALFSVLLVSLLDTWSIGRGYRTMTSKKGAISKKDAGDTKISGTAEASLAPVPHGDWEELHRRIELLDRSLLVLAENIPRAGVLHQSQSDPDTVVSMQGSFSELLSEWSDRFELAVQELSAHPTFTTDPVLMRFLAKAREFRVQAISFADMASLEAEEKNTGILKAPFFETLTEDQKDWIDRLRAALGQLHAEIRAMEGVVKAGMGRTESLQEKDEQTSSSVELPGKTGRKG